MESLVVTNQPCIGRDERRQKLVTAALFAAFIAFAVLMAVHPAFATDSDYNQQITDVLTCMISIVGTVFRAVGVILAVYAVGQLVLAFKNEDANSKASASTLLVVGVVLIAIPQILNALNLVNVIGGS